MTWPWVVPPGSQVASLRGCRWILVHHGRLKAPCHSMWKARGELCPSLRGDRHSEGRHLGTHPGDSISGWRQVFIPLWASKSLSIPRLHYVSSRSCFLKKKKKKIVYRCCLFFSTLRLQLQGLVYMLDWVSVLSWNFGWPAVGTTPGSQSRGWQVPGSSSWQTWAWWVP